MKKSRLVLFVLACIMIITICACGSEAVSEAVMDNTDETADSNKGAANEYKANSGDTMTINLKNNGDGKSHYAIVSVSMYLDSKDNDYHLYSDGGLDPYDAVICDTVRDVISGYTIDEMTGNEGKVKNELLDELQSLFKSKVIAKVDFPIADYK